MFAQRTVTPQKNLRTALAEKAMKQDAPSNLNLPDGRLKVTNFAPERMKRTPDATSDRIKRAAEEYGIITEAPAGRRVVYSKSAGVYYNLWGYNIYSDEDELVGEVVYAEDNTVYIKNPVTGRLTNSYMKGTIDENNVITVTLPQPIMAEDYYGDMYLYNVDRLVFSEEEDFWWYYPDKENHEVKFTVRNDSLIFSETTGDVILGLTYADFGDWTGEGDYNITYAPFNDKTIELPANIETENYTLIKGLAGQNVKVAFDGNDAYLGGIFSNLPDGYIIGTRNGDKITFATDQYLGPDDIYGYHTYFMSANGKLVWNYDRYDSEYTKTDEIVFTYNEADKTLIADSKGDSTVLINAGKKQIYYIEALDAPVIKQFPRIEGAVKPMTPIITELESHEDSGYGIIAFDLPMYDVDGNFLDVNKLHYNLFIDDELLTLYTDEYKKLTEDMTDIPYTFNDNYDIVYNEGTYHFLYFYAFGFDKMGVQLVYTADNGDIGESDIAWQYLTTTGIDNAKTAPQARIGKVSYTDLSGRELSAPAKGISIKTVTYEDGTKKSFKVVKR